jgi:hypothetical protein
MAFRKSQPEKPKKLDVDLAVRAVEDSGRPLDLDAGDPDSSPTSLGLPAPQEAKACPHHRYVCAVCGMPLPHD